MCPTTMLPLAILFVACAPDPEGRNPGGSLSSPSTERPALDGWEVGRSFSLAPRAGNALSPASVVTWGDRLWFTSSHSPAIGMVDLGDGGLERVYALSEPPGQQLLALDGPGRWLYIAKPHGTTLSRLDLDTGSLETVDVPLDVISSLTWDSTHDALLVAGTSGGEPVLARLLEDGTMEEAATAVVATGVSVDPMRGRIGLAGRASSGGIIQELGADRLEERARWSIEGAVGTITADRDGWLFDERDTIVRASAEGLRDLVTPGDDISGLSFSSDGALWVLREGVGADADTGMTLGELVRYEGRVPTLVVDALGGPRSLAPVRGTDAVATPSGDTSEILVTDADGAQRRIPTGHSPSVVRASPVDPGILAIVDRLGGEVTVRAGPRVRVRWETDGWPCDLAWDPDGSAVYVYENGRDAVTRLDAVTGEATVLFDDSRTNRALLFGTIVEREGVLYVAAGGLGVVRALSTDGDLLWETTIADTIGRDGPDRFNSLSVGVDDLGQVWVLDSLRTRVTVLDADGAVLESTTLPGAVDNDALFIGGGRVLLGPYEADPSTLAVTSEPVFDAERALASVDGVLLLDDDDGFWFEGGAVYDHSERIYGGGYRAVWDEGVGGVWLARFATAEVELVLPMGRTAVDGGG